MLIFGEESLMAIAQIAIALIGFSGVVVTLGRTKGSQWSESDLLQLRTLVEPSIVVFVGAFLPLGTALAEIQTETVWRVSNAMLFCLLGIAHSLFLIRAGKQKNAVVRSQTAMGFLGAFVYISLVASAFNLTSYHQLTFLVGLIYGLFVSVHNFYLLLFRVESVGISDRK